TIYLPLLFAFVQDLWGACLDIGNGVVQHNPPLRLTHNEPPPTDKLDLIESHFRLAIKWDLDV
ncbi:hypothetical protein OG21DRAFT_1506586, partial [Imleria badia]